MHKELGAKRTVGVHYATWILSDEHYLAPPTELMEAATREKVRRQVMPGQLGRTVVFGVEDEESFGDEKMEKVEVEEDEIELIDARGGKCVVWR